MPDPLHSPDATPHAPLQARIAGVALITTVCALMAACVCFMVQQWTVARQEARAHHLILGQMVAAGAAAPLAAGDIAGVRQALQAVSQAPHVAGVRIEDFNGHLVAQVGSAPQASQATQTVERGIILDGRRIGTLAQAMEGVVTDDNGQPLPAQTMDVIGTELQTLYDTLEQRDLAAGSPLARRLFS